MSVLIKGWHKPISCMHCTFRYVVMDEEQRLNFCEVTKELCPWDDMSICPITEVEDEGEKK